MIRANEFDPSLPSRLKQSRYSAYIANWALSGSGDTKHEAIANLNGVFQAVKAEKEKHGEPLPRPGTQVPIQFASRDLVDQHADLADDFVRRVLDLPWALITDESSLWHFHSDETNGVFVSRIREVYGVDVSDIESAKLAEIFDRIAATRSIYNRDQPDSTV